MPPSSTSSKARGGRGGRGTAQLSSPRRKSAEVAEHSTSRQRAGIAQSSGKAASREYASRAFAESNVRAPNAIHETPTPPSAARSGVPKRLAGGVVRALAALSMHKLRCALRAMAVLSEDVVLTHLLSDSAVVFAISSGTLCSA